MVASSRTDEVNIFSIYLILPAAPQTSGIFSLKQKWIRKRKNVSGDRERPAAKADNLTAICDPTVQTIFDPQHLTTL
jgi:hypothetical protein